ASSRRIKLYLVLETARILATADLLALQTDFYSAFDRFCAERFVYALDHSKNLSDRSRQARDLMRDWNGSMSADSSAAVIEVLARRELARILLDNKLKSSANPTARPLQADDYRCSIASVLVETVL